MFKSINIWLNSLGARIERYFRGREVIKVLNLYHAQELAQLPGEQWALARRRQIQEIQAVKDGQYDIIDRRSWAYPYIPEALHRLNQPILKNTPYNLRRFSETPIPRRAISMIVQGVLSLDWEISPTKEALQENDNKITPDLQEKCNDMTYCFRNPNNKDSWNTFSQAVIEDIVVGAYGSIEPRITPYYKRPVKMWPIDGTTIRIYADWSESTPEKPHYAQLTGLKGERGIISFRDDEISYIRTNIRSSTPFGLGSLEVAFNSVNAFLGAQDMSARSASDQIHKTWMWWEQPQAQGFLQTVRRHIQDEIEGQGKTSLIAGFKKPEILDVKAVSPEDLLLEWQEFLIRIIGISFNLSPQNFGLERDVNRNTSETMSETDFKSAVVPIAVIYAEHLNRDIIWKLVGWKDIQFNWIGLEDPDAASQADIWNKYYMLDSITPDEIRKKLGEAPLPGGWGKLTHGQMLILQMNARSDSTKSRSASEGVGEPQMTPDVMQQLLQEYSPDEIKQMQQQGLIPQSPEEDQEQNDDVLDKFSDQIQRFLDRADKQYKKRTRIKGKPNESALKKDQMVRFKKREHEQTREEKMARNIEKRRQFALTHRPNNKSQGNQFTGRFR